MTVGELIKELQSFDKEKEIFYRQCSDTWGSINYAYIQEDSDFPDRDDPKHWVIVIE